MKTLLTLAILFATTVLQSQTTIYVTPNGTGDGTSWADAGSLENAISVVERNRISTSLNDQTEIWVQKGTYYPSKMLVIPDSVKIYGGFAGVETALSQRNFVANPTIVDGQQKIGSIFRLENSAEINGFTIQNGFANGNSQKNGGGIWADENCVIENCKIINNTAMLNGGGVYANGKVTIINSSVEENVANGNGSNTFGNCLVIKSNESNVSPNNIVGCNKSIPDFGEISFKTDKIWKITANNINQEWSDVVMAEGCNKTWYNGGNSGNYSSDCRANLNRATYGDLFSWCAVARFAHVLCPAPWRVPTVEDFGNLDKALGGNGDGSGPGTTGTDTFGKYYQNTTIRDQYVDTWGGSYGGCECNTGTITQQGTNANFWTQSAQNGGSVFYSVFHSNGRIRPQGFLGKQHAFMLRCIR